MASDVRGRRFGQGVVDEGHYEPAMISISRHRGLVPGKAQTNTTVYSSLRELWLVARPRRDVYIFAHVLEFAGTLRGVEKSKTALRNIPYGILSRIVT